MGKRPHKLHMVKDGKFVASRKGKPICPEFNLGTCTSLARDGLCTNHPGHVHLCNVCLSPTHNATNCDRTEAGPPPSGAQPSSSGKGWNKGGKSQWSKGGKSWGKGGKNWQKGAGKNRYYG